MALLTLGDFIFDHFEVPERIGFGGRQQLAVHKLIGGARLVDTLGPDDAAIRWSGVFSGSDAGDRARALDAMRVEGLQLPLNWDAFCYLVLIETLSLQFNNPWWVPYQISCLVVRDLAEAGEAIVPSLADSLFADLSAAGLYTDTSGAIAATQVAGALFEGSTQYAAAATTLQTTSSSIDRTIALCQNGLNSSQLSTVVSSSGSLAQLYAARAYIQRAIANLDNTST
jgi:hypothetical protein